MTGRICLLCFTVIFLLIQASKAQIIPGYVPPLYNVPKIVNQGLNTYLQTQQIAKAANGLGLPVPQPQNIVTNVALPLLPPAQKLAMNVGLPLLRPAQSLQTNVGLPLLPKIFPGGLPTLPQMPAIFTAGTKLRALPASTLLLNTNPLLPRLSPLQIRSTGQDANTEKEQAETAINPINEVSDDEFKEVVGSSGSFSNETTADESHQTKTRSPNNKGNEDEFDYLSKAANPIDDIGSMMKKLGHGLKHTMEKIDTTLWPSHAKPEPKDADAIDTIPFKTWAQNYQIQNNFTLSPRDLMSKYIQILNEGRNPEFRVPEELAFLGLSNRNALNEFQKSISQSSLLQNGKSTTFPQKSNIQDDNNPMEKFWNSAAKLADNFVDAMSSGKNRNEPSDLGQKNNPINKYSEKGPGSANPMNDNKDWQKILDLAGQMTDSNKDIDDQVSSNQRNNPMDKFWNSASKFVGNLADVVTKAEKPDNEVPEKYQKNNPINNFDDGNLASAKNMGGSIINSEKINASAKNMGGSIINSEKINANQYGHNMESHQALNPVFWNTASMAGKDAQFGIHPNGNYYGNQQMFHPYSSTFGGTYNQWNQPGSASSILNSATNLAHDIAGFNNGYTGYYKSSNPSEISNPITQYTATYPILSRMYRQMPLIPSRGRFGSAHFGLPRVSGPLGSHIGPMGVPGSFGRGHFSPHVGPIFKRSGSPGNIWDSATGLAGSITSIATNPGQINSGQILGSTGTIFNAATNLAGNIGNVATNPSSITTNNKYLGSKIGNKNNQESSPTDIEKISSDKLLGSYNQGESLLNPINPVGTIMNSATNLGSKITNLALNPANVANKQLLASVEPLGSVSNQAVDMAGKIVNTALNPGLNGNGQVLQSLGPTYAGGFFPRSNPSGSIVNSATQLASQILNTATTNSGNIGKIPLLRSSLGIGNLADALPLGSIFNSATKLAGDITNTATAPGKLLVR